MLNTSSFRFAFALFSLLTIFTSTSYAQQRWSAGPRVGANLSSFWGDADNFNYKPGLVAGGFVMYSSLNHFGISADVLYSQRGARFRSPGLDFTQRINYLEVPIALRYFLNRSGSFRPNILLGPSVGFRLNSEVANVSINGRPSPSNEYTNPNQIRAADLGLMAGFQLNWRAGDRQRFLVDARYTLGMTDIRAVPELHGKRDPLRNSVFTLTLGYGFGIGREYPSRYRR